MRKEKPDKPSLLKQWHDDNLPPYKREDEGPPAKRPAGYELTWSAVAKAFRFIKKILPGGKRTWTF